MAQHNVTGAFGEQIATHYLEQMGYIVMARNYRFKKAEIDIIARKEKILLFVEVKTRRAQNYGYPEESVTSKKEALFLLAAEEYIFRINWLYDIRFDIISITMTSEKEYQLHHIEDAFH